MLRIFVLALGFALLLITGGCATQGISGVLNKETREPIAGALVQDTAALDAQVRAVYEGMVSRLRAGDIEGALAFFTPGAAPQYREIFEDIGADLPSVANMLGTLTGGSVMGPLAEYLLVRDLEGGVKQGFFVYLVRGP